MGFHTGWRRSPDPIGRPGPPRRRPLRPWARGPPSPTLSSGPAGMPRATAGRVRPGAATSALPGSADSRVRTAAGPGGRSPCPAAPPAPMRRRVGPPMSRAPRAKPAWPCGRAEGTQAARAQHPGVPTSRFSLACPKPRRTSVSSILVSKPQPALIQVARSRQGRTDAFATLLRHRRRWSSQHPRRPWDARAVKPREILGSSSCALLASPRPLSGLRSAGRGGEDPPGPNDHVIDSAGSGPEPFQAPA